MFIEVGGENRRGWAICPPRVGVEKAQGPEPGEGTVRASAQTPFLRPICLDRPHLHHIKESKKLEPDGGGHAALWVTRTRSWPGPGTILNPRPKLPPQPAWPISGYKATSHLPATSSSPPWEPPRPGLGSMRLGATLLSVGLSLSIGINASLHSFSIAHSGTVIPLPTEGPISLYSD